MARNALRMYMHLVWATWDRMPLIGSAIERDLYRFLSAVAEDMHCTPVAIGGMPDHVHMLVTYPATCTVADLVERPKGSSSRFVNQRLQPGEFFKWQGHYAAASVCASHKEQVRLYIKSQKRHHALGTTWPAAEQTFEDDPPPGDRD